ncbi:MAG TPA: ornithine cyclodeaminase family protein [Alphaproteobacteria bacterium]|jgi:ornithine cyclodeaminase/alanine dehydrogenase-like protein (mu-crystallin family)
MTLIINNDDVSKLLTMGMTIDALEAAYRQLVAKESVCRPRIDVQIPTKDPRKVYQWGSMEGGSMSGYFAIRMKSDVVYEQSYNGVTTQEKYCTRPGLYCGLIFLTSTENGEPLAFINDGVLQHMRVGADGGIGTKYMAREDASVIGMLGSGGMARTHMAAFMHVRPNLKKLQVFSPTKANREAFGKEMRELYGLEVQVCDRPEEIYKDAHIVAGVTDSAVPVLNGELIEKGAHVVNVGAGGRPDEKTIDRLDVYMRFGSAPAPWGLPEFGLDDEFLTYAAQPEFNSNFKLKRSGKRGHGTIAADRIVTFADIIGGTNRGRSSKDQITYSERGNLQGNQFWAVAGAVYEAAKTKGVGREIPTEWFLQDIRD